jgi:hypothetical protein
MKFHINPKTGEPGKCSAENGNCPFGSADEHYTSAEAARTAFEKSNETFSLSLKEMNAQAKTTDDPVIIKKLIAAGSDRTLGNLAKNANLQTEDAEAILEKTTNPVIRAALYMNKKLVLKFDDITPDDLEEIAFRQNPRDNDPLYYPTDNPLARMAKDPFITEAHYDRLSYSNRVPSNVKKGLPTLLAQANKIPSVRTIQWLEKNNWPRYPLNPDVALMAGKLKEDDLATAPDIYISHFSATGPSPRLTTKEVDTLARVALKRDDDRLISMTSSDSRISSKSLEAIVAAGKGNEGLYKNPKLTSEAKAMIENQFANEPFVRVGKLKDSIGQTEFDSIMKPAGGAKLGNTYHETRLDFDTAKIKEYGLTREDILHMANARGFNAGVSYNPETGEFSGRVDSSG